MKGSKNDRINPRCVARGVRDDKRERDRVLRSSNDVYSGGGNHWGSLSIPGKSEKGGCAVAEQPQAKPRIGSHAGRERQVEGLLCDPERTFRDTPETGYNQLFRYDQASKMRAIFFSTCFMLVALSSSSDSTVRYNGEESGKTVREYVEQEVHRIPLDYGFRAVDSNLKALRMHRIDSLQTLVEK